MKYLLILLTIILSCSEPINNSPDIYVGIIQDASVIPTAFNESVKMQIKTDKIVVVIYDIATVNIGDSAFIKNGNKNDWRKKFTWQSSNRYYIIY